MENKQDQNLYAVKGAFAAINLPIIREINSKDYVFFGLDNLYPVKLVELYNTSAMHKTAIDAKQAALIGEGIKMYGETIVNAKGETLNEVFAKLALDEWVFGARVMNVVWNRSGDRIVEVYHIPANKVRSGKLDEEDNINEYYYSSDWKQPRKFKPKAYRAFNMEDNKGDNASQILYIKTYNPETDYYGLPSYVSALNDIELDARISRFHNANISNGLAPSMAINFRNGIPTPDERQIIYREIEDTFAGENNAGRFFLLFSEPGREAEITPITSANDTYYTTLEERVSSRILTAHRITSPLLLGIRTTGSGLGNNSNEIETAYAHFFGTVIEPVQKKLLKDMQFVTTLMGFQMSLEIEQSTIDFEDTVDGEETQPQV
jgi:hypothetical protein